MILNWKKKNKDDKPSDVKGVRDMLIRFIKDQLQKFDGGEGGNIYDMQLFIACSNDERVVYDAAVYQNEEDKFKLEVQKVADDYAIDLPEEWLFNITFTDKFPEGAIKSADGKLAIIVNTKKTSAPQTSVFSKAVINILSGETGDALYEITPASGKINIGRGREVKLDDGSIRINQIAFTEDSANAINRFVSRRHAHLEWDGDAACLMLYADEGGIPPGNKTKIKTASNEKTVKVNAANMAYRLNQGDQVILGDSAVLEIRYKAG